MTAAGTSLFTGHQPGNRLADEAVSVLGGAAFTLGLFLAMAYFEHGGTHRAPPVIEDLRAITLPLDEPPPPVVQPEAQPVSNTVTGLDVAAAESPVKIAVSLPPLETVFVPLAPPAKIQTSTLYTEFKPKMELNTTDFQRVFQQSEVDQRPGVLVNTSPFIPPNVRKNADLLRVELLMVIDVAGTAGNIRVLNSSGNPAFDALIVKLVQEEWVFSPAIKKGRKVKCLVQRTVTIRWNTSPFES